MDYEKELIEIEKKKMKALQGIDQSLKSLIGCANQGVSINVVGSPNAHTYDLIKENREKSKVHCV